MHTGIALITARRICLALLDQALNTRGAPTLLVGSMTLLLLYSESGFGGKCDDDSDGPVLTSVPLWIPLTLLSICHKRYSVGMMGLVVSVITIPSDNLRRRGREEGGCDDRERIAVLSARRGCRSKIPHPFGLTLQYHEDDLVGSASMQPPTNDVTYPSLAVWKRALLFHLHNWNNLLLISPLLLLPVVTDVLHTVLIRQTLERKGLVVGSAVLQAFRALPALIALKFYFWCQGLLWSFVPLYGWIKDIDIRICWAMASNVLVFERASTTNCRRRCWELAQHPQKGMAIRTLITVPAILVASSLVAFSIISLFIESKLVFWIWIVVVLWVLLAGSAAANTYTYLRIENRNLK